MIEEVIGPSEWNLIPNLIDSKKEFSISHPVFEKERNANLEVDLVGMRKDEIAQSTKDHIDRSGRGNLSLVRL